ncbi:MAG TPA: hypothetical protein VFF49_11280 [Thermodesulfobacteriota bacterium]|nr:hypothetical protein [Thermodesulfobacteriota bacterium]
MKERGKRYIDPEKQFCVHPDMIQTFKNYDGTKDSFKKTFGERDELVKNGDVFWNTEHDEEMLKTARDNTDNAAAGGWRFPQRKRRK